jgi:hypothetical protein
VNRHDSSSSVKRNNGGDISSTYDPSLRSTTHKYNAVDSDYQLIRCQNTRLHAFAFQPTLNTTHASNSSNPMCSNQHPACRLGILTSLSTLSQNFFTSFAMLLATLRIRCSSSCSTTVPMLSFIHGPTTTYSSTITYNSQIPLNTQQTRSTKEPPHLQSPILSSYHVQLASVHTQCHLLGLAQLPFSLPLKILPPPPPLSTPLHSIPDHHLLTTYDTLVWKSSDTQPHQQNDSRGHEKHPQRHHSRTKVVIATASTVHEPFTDIPDELEAPASSPWPATPFPPAQNPSGSWVGLPPCSSAALSCLCSPPSTAYTKRKCKPPRQPSPISPSTSTPSTSTGMTFDNFRTIHARHA